MVLFLYPSALVLHGFGAFSRIQSNEVRKPCGGALENPIPLVRGRGSPGPSPGRKHVLSQGSCTGSSGSSCTSLPTRGRCGNPIASSFSGPARPGGSRGLHVCSFKGWTTKNHGVDDDPQGPNVHLARGEEASARLRSVSTHRTGAQVWCVWGERKRCPTLRECTEGNRSFPVCGVSLEGVAMFAFQDFGRDVVWSASDGGDVTGSPPLPKPTKATNLALQRSLPTSFQPLTSPCPCSPTWARCSQSKPTYCSAHRSAHRVRSRFPSHAAPRVLRAPRRRRRSAAFRRRSPAAPPGRSRPPRTPAF